MFDVIGSEGEIKESKVKDEDHRCRSLKEERDSLRLQLEHANEAVEEYMRSAMRLMQNPYDTLSMSQYQVAKDYLCDVMGIDWRKLV